MVGLCLSLGSCGVFQKKPTEPTKKNAATKGDIKPYEQVITKKAKTDEGLFKVHYVDKKYMFEIPDSLLNREM